MVREQWVEEETRALSEKLWTDQEGLWAEAARAVSWVRRPRTVFEDGARVRFPDGTLNACFNALDRHVVAGRAEAPALVGDDVVTGARRRYTYAQLLDLVARFGGALTACGVEAGDHVLIHLPPCPEAVVAMLGCARIGAVHTVLSRPVEPVELASLVRASEPTVAVAPARPEPGMRTRLEEAFSEAGFHPVNTVVVGNLHEVGEVGQTDLQWSTLLREGTVPPAGCLPMAATAPLFRPVPPDPLTPVDEPDTGFFTVSTDWATRAGGGSGPGDAVVLTDGFDAGTGVWGTLLAGATLVLTDDPAALDGAVADGAEARTWAEVAGPVPPGMLPTD